jgi:probable HAF family extracellular repeat protein
MKTTTYTFTTLDDPLGYGTMAEGINNAGLIVGNYQSAVGGSVSNNVFLYSSGSYTTIDVPLSDSFTGGINDQGQIVGYYRDGHSNFHGFLYSGGSYTTIDNPNNPQDSVAVGINNKGQIVGDYIEPNPSAIGHGYLYSNGTFTTLDVPGSSANQATAINDKGDIVGFYNDSITGVEHGYFYSHGTYTILDDPEGTFTKPQGINNKDQIVGDYIDSSGHMNGFIYDHGTFTTITDPLGQGVETTVVNGINEQGQIVGWYNDGTNNGNASIHGFVADPVHGHAGQNAASTVGVVADTFAFAPSFGNTANAALPAIQNPQPQLADTLHAGLDTGATHEVQDVTTTTVVHASNPHVTDFHLS